MVDGVPVCARPRGKGACLGEKELVHQRLELALPHQRLLHKLGGVAGDALVCL